ncbi:MAG: hypothetical protein Q4F79_07370 [Eubacteriales bacterium]|nr:hypothetical protein [Eubacteriales bacterium]
MNVLNQAKASIGIDLSYDIPLNKIQESEMAERIFIAAYSQHLSGNSQNCAIRCALRSVWHAAKQYYAQHPDELHRVVVF